MRDSCIGDHVVAPFDVGMLRSVKAFASAPRELIPAAFGSAMIGATSLAPALAVALREMMAGSN